MNTTLNPTLLLAAALSAIAALLHVGIIFGGANWYRFFGAGEQMAQIAEAGRWYPALITAGIALILFAWAAYAASAAGLLPALPLLKPALCLITAIYLLRGLAPVPLYLLAPEQLNAFMLWSSVICLGYGLTHLFGLLQRWASLA